MKRSLVLISALACLLGLRTAHGATFGDLGPYFSFTYGDGGGIPADVHNVTGQQTAPDGQSVKLFGELGPIDGARFQSGFVLDWTGPINGPFNPGDKFVVDLDFNVQVSGGALAWSFYGNVYYGGFPYPRILTDLISFPSGQVSGVHLESSEFTEPGDGGTFDGYLHIDWTGYGPGDKFSISIPQDSIDVTFVPVPEPRGLTIAVAGIVIACIRIWRLRRG